MKNFWMVGAAGIALLASGAAIAHNHGGMKMDVDGNGEVTRAEATTAANAAFAKLDANNDGVLNVTDRAERKADRFATMDANKDGQLSKAEMEAAHAARMEKRGERGGKRIAKMSEEQKAEWQAKRDERHAAHFAAMDTDKNGALSEAEFTAGHAKMGEGRGGKHHGKRGGHGRGDMMAKVDTNGDKAVSKAEFTSGAMARFDAMDSDKNGVVSVAERKAMKGKRGHGRDMAPDMPPPPAE